MRDSRFALHYWGGRLRGGWEMMQPGADGWDCPSAQTGCQDATSCTPQRGEVGPHIHELSYVALGRAERRVSTRIPRRAPHKWAISCTSVENSSAGCIPERSVIFPPCERPFAGAIRSEHGRGHQSDDFHALLDHQGCGKGRWSRSLCGVLNRRPAERRLAVSGIRTWSGRKVRSLPACGQRDDLTQTNC